MASFQDPQFAEVQVIRKSLLFVISVAVVGYFLAQVATFNMSASKTEEASHAAPATISHPPAGNETPEISTGQQHPPPQVILDELRARLAKANEETSRNPEYRNRLAMIGAGEIVETKIRGFENDLKTIKDRLRTMEQIAPRLTTAASQIDEAATGLTYLGAILHGSSHAAGNDGLMRVYHSDSLGTIALVEYDTNYVRATMDPAVVNDSVNGRSASLVKEHDSQSGESISTLNWTTEGKTYSLRMGRTDLASISQLRSIANSITEPPRQP